MKNCWYCLFVRNSAPFQENHHPSLEFDCGKAVLIIRRAFVCVCARMCVVHLSTCLVIASFHYGAAGGRAALQHWNEINDPWFFRCDQQTKLSSRSETKGVTGGTKPKGTVHRSCWRLRRGCAGFHARGALGGFSGQTPNTHTYTSALYISLSASPLLPPLPHPLLLSSPLLSFPPETFCQMLPDSHICAENELYPRALWVKDSLVKNAVLLDEQTNVPCNVVALAFYATLKESINLHNSNERVLPLWRHG